MRRQHGFTIVELMIATGVFSMLLVVILTAVTRIGRMYYKGLTTARTQEVARIVLDDIAQQIQYSGGGADGSIVASQTSTSPVTKAICVGKERYFYQLNQQVSSASTHALWHDSDGGCDSAIASTATMTQLNPTNSATGKELLPEGMRLLRLEVSGFGYMQTVTVRVAYGANDLLEDSSGKLLTDSAANYATATCAGSQIGTQFCAVSELTTTVTKRTP